MRQLTTEEHQLVYRIKSKWTEVCDGLMDFTGSMRPLLMLEFQGYLDYLKVIENRIAFWELKNLVIDHKIAPHDSDGKIIEFQANAQLEIYLPGKIGEISIYLSYYNNNQKDKLSHRWREIVNEIEENND